MAPCKINICLLSGMIICRITLIECLESLHSVIVPDVPEPFSHGCYIGWGELASEGVIALSDAILHYVVVTHVRVGHAGAEGGACGFVAPCLVELDAGVGAGCQNLCKKLEDTSCCLQLYNVTYHSLSTEQRARSPCR